MCIVYESRATYYKKKKLKQFPNTISVFHRIWALYHSSTINIMSITYDSTTPVYNV